MSIWTETQPIVAPDAEKRGAGELFVRLGNPKHHRKKRFLIPMRDRAIFLLMRIISRRTLKEFWERHPDAEQPLLAWYADMKQASWGSPSDIKSTYRNARFVANNRVVVHIKGNSYRVVVAIQYQFGIVYIRFVGTHEEYDRIDATTV